jgi:cytochrome P450
MPDTHTASSQDGRALPKPHPPNPQINARQLVREPLAFFSTLTRQYGDIIRYRPAPEPAYLVNHPDFIRHVLVENSRNYSKATYINQMFKSAVADGLLTAEGDAWRQQRRLMQPAFHQTRIASLDRVVSGAAQKMLESWEEVARVGGSIDIAREMSLLTLTITVQALFGVDIGADADTVGDLVLMGGGLIEKPRHPRFQNAVEGVEKVVYSIIAERRRSNVEKDDLLSMLMKARDEQTGAGMDDRQLRDQVMTLLLAGYETTASALTWNWFLLSQHPQESQRLHNEVVDALGERLPDSSDLPLLEYAHRVFDETLRLYPPAWILGRKTLSDDEIGGYAIPAGSVIAISPYTVHRHPGFWEEPDTFDPDRFTPQRSAGRHKFAYIPFGAGPRQCIGNNFAMLEAQLIIAMVARRFRLHLEPDQSIQPEAIFVLRPRGEIRMRLEKAQPSPIETTRTS